MKKHITILFLSILFLSGNAQSITGRILEKGDFPIPYATVQINDKNGVLTNGDGDFTIETKGYKPTDSITISYMGFKKRTFLLSKFKAKSYYLEEDVIALTDVLISNKKLSVIEIVEKIKENAAENYTSINTKRQIFERKSYAVNFSKFEFEISKSTLLNKKKIKEVNKSINRSIKPFFNKTIKEYGEDLGNLYQTKDTSFVEVLKAIRLVNKTESVNMDSFQDLMLGILKQHLEKDATYKVKSGIMKVSDSMDVSKMNDANKKHKDSLKAKFIKGSMLDIMLNNSVSNEKGKLDFIYTPKKYKYKLEGVSRFDDEKIYIISFKPKRRSAKFAGKMYVNANDFAAVKIDYGYAIGKRGKVVNLKMLLGVKNVENLWKSTIMYKQNTNGKYELKMLNQEEGDYVYVNRPMKFTKNKTEQDSSKKTLKLNFKFELTQSQKTEMYFISEKPFDVKKENIKDYPKKVKIHYVDNYSNTIWKDYRVLTPVQEIKDYDTGE